LGGWGPNAIRFLRGAFQHQHNTICPRSSIIFRIWSLSTNGTLCGRGSLLAIGTLIFFGSLFYHDTLTSPGSLCAIGILKTNGSLRNNGILTYNGSLMTLGTLSLRGFIQQLVGSRHFGALLAPQPILGTC
jgi:hypothetical protein